MLDLQLDTSSPSGALVANVMASVSEWERRIIGARTKDALAIKKAQGVQLGRPREVGDDVVEQIRSLHLNGHRIAEITRRLNADGIRAPRGGVWHRASISRVLSQLRTASGKTEIAA